MDTERTIAGNPWGLEPLPDVKELAGYLHVPVSTVYDWRTRGLGPRIQVYSRGRAYPCRSPARFPVRSRPLLLVSGGGDDSGLGLIAGASV